MRLALALVALTACDPIWSVRAQLRDPASQPIGGATLAVACRDDSTSRGDTQRSDDKGAAAVGGLGDRFPVGCDIYVAKPGFRTHRIRYHDLCPNGPDDCDRVFAFELVLVPER